MALTIQQGEAPAGVVVDANPGCRGVMYEAAADMHWRCAADGFESLLYQVARLLGRAKSILIPRVLGVDHLAL